MSDCVCAFTKVIANARINKTRRRTDCVIIHEADDDAVIWLESTATAALAI